jgi:hypothetical protein
MVGVIWYVQLVHYPLMDRVAAAAFPAFHREHSRRTSWVVVGPMMCEATTAGLLLVPGLARAPTGLASVGVVLVVLLWVSTFTVQVPLHRRLAAGFDPAVHRRLVSGNWLRTAAWSARGVVAVLVAAHG